MGLFGPSKAQLAAMETDTAQDGLTWGADPGGWENRKPGRHHGGNLHGDPKETPTGKHHGKGPKKK